MADVTKVTETTPGRVLAIDPGPEIAEEELVSEIELALGFGCQAKDVAKVLRAMYGKPRTYACLYQAVRAAAAEKDDE